MTLWSAKYLLGFSLLKFEDFFFLNWSPTSDADHELASLFTILVIIVYFIKPVTSFKAPQYKIPVQVSLKLVKLYRRNQGISRFLDLML